MDEFAQSRGDDDLFDDEIIPIAQPAQPVQDITTQVNQITFSSSSAPPTSTEKSSHDASRGTRGRGGGRGRGRGIPPQPSMKSDLAQSKYAPKPAATRKQPLPVTKKESPPTATTEAPKEPSIAEPEVDPPEASTTLPSSSSPQPPTGPSNPTPARPPAVRGDRTKTGGLARPKLTEEELNAKLLAAKERSQNLAAAHARAQADAESFAERERIASHVRAKETAERKVMEGERERNRERKLRGQGGREWDAIKQEADFAGRGRGVPRQAPEDVDNDLSMYEWNEDRGRGRGRGGRGSRGGRGRGGGRGDRFSNDTRGPPRPQQQPDLKEDFPALPASSTNQPTTDQKSSLDRMASDTDGPSMSSWADQVEAATKA